MIPTWALIILLATPDGSLSTAHALAGFTSHQLCLQAAKRVEERSAGRIARTYCVRQS